MFKDKRWYYFFWGICLVLSVFFIVYGALNSQAQQVYDAGGFL